MFDVIVIMFLFDLRMEAVSLLSFVHQKVKVQCSCSLIDKYNTVK